MAAMMMPGSTRRKFTPPEATAGMVGVLLGVEVEMEVGDDAVVSRDVVGATGIEEEVVRVVKV